VTALLVPAVALAAQPGFWTIVNDPRLLSEAVLIAIAAIVIGFVVRRVWPRAWSPYLFGTLAGVLFVALLAYAGVATAAAVLWLAIIAGVILGLLAVFLG
jgi:hypothetical protein